MQEIKQSGVGRIVIIHGGGSFGHPLAKKYKLYENLKEKKEEQIYGFSLTHQAMKKLNLALIEEFHAQHLPAVSLHPLSYLCTRNGHIEKLNVDIFRKLLEMGCIPVTHGDIVLDEEKGIYVLSGDQLVSELAVKLKADRVVIAVDVNGLYTDDPKLNPNAKFLEKLNCEELVNKLGMFKETQTLDVTGGMRRKILELIKVLKSGISVTIVNAIIDDRLLKVLRNEEVICTKIIP